MIPSLLLIDVGNTRLKWATASVQPGAPIQQQGALETPLTSEQQEAEIEAIARDSRFLDHAVIVASVVPEVTASLATLFSRLTIVNGDLPTLGYGLTYPCSRQLGADRLADAAAAHAAGVFPALTINCGTATVINVLDAQGCFAGGLILPGLTMQLRALQNQAAQLREVEVKLETIEGFIRAERNEQGVSPPPSRVARSTAEAMLRGVWLSFRGGLRESVGEISAEVKPRAIYLTGGSSPASPDDLSEATGVPLFCDPLLTFRGLQVIGSRSVN